MSNLTERVILSNVTVDLSTIGGLVNGTNFTTSPYPDYGCDYREYEIVAAIVAAISIIFGILFTFFGYRFFKAVMFLTGFIFCAVLVYTILGDYNVLPPEGTLGCAVGAGILLGLVVMLVQQIGLFLTGFMLGLSVAMVLLFIVEQFVHLDIIWIPVAVLLALGITLGLLGLKVQKAVTIAGTSVIGGSLVLAGMDYYVELSRLIKYFRDRTLARSSVSICWFSWIILAMWPVLFIAGAIIQWKITGLDVNHRLVLRNRREQAASVQQVKVKGKRETQQTRYRHLYQARRVKGDVISQTFLHSIESKLSPAMQSLTALNMEPSMEEESTATTTLTHLT